jgi:OOP family OmpA-OmpF porin
MKNRVLFVLVLFYLGYFSSYASRLAYQENDSLIKVVGVISDQDDGKPVVAKVYYEKLPYFDDIGISSSKKVSGSYEVYMIIGNEYLIEVKGDGFEPTQKEVKVVDEGNGQMTLNFSLKPDFGHKKIAIENLNFASGRSVISSSSYVGLDVFAEWLDARPNAIVQLDGHTDFQGNANANLNLSQDRVDAVQVYLIKKGIKKNRIRTKAFGGKFPITLERTSEGKAKNRRVEVQIIQQ